MAFLPVTREEMERLGWDAPDFVLVTGDAYVDHPSVMRLSVGFWKAGGTEWRFWRSRTGAV